MVEFSCRGNVKIKGGEDVNNTLSRGGTAHSTLRGELVDYEDWF